MAVVRPGAIGAHPQGRSVSEGRQGEGFLASRGMTATRGPRGTSAVWSLRVSDAVPAQSSHNVQIEIGDDGGEFRSTVDESRGGAGDELCERSVEKGDVGLTVQTRFVDDPVRLRVMGPEGS